MLKGIQRIACTLLGTGLLLCMGSSGAAEDGTRTIALRAAHLFDATSEGLRDDAVVIVHDGKIVAVGGEAARSEEHTSELQSLMRNSYAVCCLKQKKHKNSKQDTR